VGGAIVASEYHADGIGVGFERLQLECLHGRGSLADDLELIATATEVGPCQVLPSCQTRL